MPFLSAGVESVAQDLRTYGEWEAAQWVVHCSDDELLRICGIASWLTTEGPSTRSGAGMLYSKALAWAAVYVKEGAARDLARQRRDLSQVEYIPEPQRRPSPNQQRALDPFHGVTPTVRDYWQSRS